MGLTAESLACRRGNHLLFTELSFNLGSGDLLVLRGANGAGKTSLLRLLAGLIRPVAGRVLWNGTAITQDPEAYFRQLHYLGHLDGLKPAFTARENLYYSAQLRGTTATLSALNHFGLAALADTPIRLLSAGQRRRIALARLLASPAPLWLLDEPSAALDHGGAQLLEQTVTDHCHNGGIAVIASHDSVLHPLAKVLEINSQHRNAA